MTEAICTNIVKGLCLRKGSIFRTETNNQSYIWSKVSKKRKERIVPPKFSPT